MSGGEQVHLQLEFTKQKAVKRRKTMEGKGDGLVS
jgi:hypothetical protein